MSAPYVTFNPAQYYKGKTSYVAFYVINPITNKMERKRIKLNHIKKAADREKYARVLCHNINEKLFAGWNPFFDELSVKGISIVDAVKKFLLVKTKNSRKDTVRSYRSFSAIFLAWIEQQRLSETYCFMIKKEHVIKYLEDVEVSRNLSNRSYNNYASFLYTLFEFFVTKGWISENPALDIPKKRLDKKTRVIIPKDVRARIKDYFQANAPYYYYVMLMCYRMLIRPKEITMLKIENIDFKNNLLTIPTFVAKNHNERILAIPEEIMCYLKNLQNMPSEWYLFSNKHTYKPGKQCMFPTRIAEKWSEMRNELGLPKEYQFYSLKDTGITEMLEAGVPAKFVKELADHHSFEMTERYVHRSEAKKIMESINLEF